MAVRRVVPNFQTVDSAHARALAAGFEVVYPLADEPWGVRRFFVRDGCGQVVNVMSHGADD